MKPPSDAPPAWHTLPVDAALARLGAAPEGLSGAEAAQRLAESGPNELQAARRISPWTILCAQFKNVLIVILLVATALSAVLGHGVEAIAIAVIVLFAVLLGFVQEYRAERAIEALRQMAAPTGDGPPRRAGGRGPGARRSCRATSSVLRAGDRVPADARLARGGQPAERKRPRSPASRSRWRSTPRRSPTAELARGRPQEHGLRRDCRHLRPGPRAWSSPPA